MATAENHPASILSSPDPTLRKYSTRQLAVANTWAEHFRYADQDRAAFVRHYLRSTSKTRCWCVVLGEPSASVRPVLAPIDCPNGLQIVELKCHDELSAESFALGHCIETYDFRAYSGRCRLLSVRSNGKSLASAEVVLVSRIAGEVPAQWRLQHLLTQQLRGPRNAVPGKSSPEKQAYDWFWSRVRTGRIPVTLEWPDMTRYMTRFATNDERRPQLAQAVAQWVIRRLEQA